MPTLGTSMLEVKNLTVAYGAHPAVQEAGLTVSSGEIVVILGANGAGKSTLLRAVSGVCEGEVKGSVTLNGDTLSGLDADVIVEHGVALVPEGRAIFGDLSVRENLLLGAYADRARSDETANLERVFRLFPKLQQRQSQIARTMSGGEQQMVAIGRAIMSAPQILMLDEPSLGLSPLLCKELFASLLEVKNTGIGILLVEQNARQSLAIADRGYLLENTRITHAASADKLATDPAVQQAYLGAGNSVATAAADENSAGKIAETAAVHSGEELASTAKFEPRSLPRRTADQQVGFSIDSLVADAALVSTKTLQTAKPDQSAMAAAAKTTTAASTPGSDRLAAVVRDMEMAAANARQRSSSRQDSQTRVSQGRMATDRPLMQSTVMRSTTTNAAKPVSDDAELPPVVIEVYRRPRVEVYRRQPDGRHVRD